MIKLKKNILLQNNKQKIVNKNILVRVDYNIDLKNKNFEDLYRIKESIPTIKFLLKNKANRIILITHIGRPKNKNDRKNLSTQNLIPLLKKFLPQVEYYKWHRGLEIPNKKLLILENIRFFKEEEQNDKKFALQLSKLGDIFINEAFSVSHRKHSSIYQLKKILPTLYGFNFQKEIENLNKVLKIKRGLCLIIGGLKIETKLPLIKKFLTKAETIILVGGIANTFLKAKGFNVGQSIIDKNYLNEARKISSSKILLPFDFVTNKNKEIYLGKIEKDEIIYDVGQQSIEYFKSEIKKAKCIVWNGPLGWIEDKKYFRGSKLMAKFLASINNIKFAGGGETLSVINKLKLNNKFNFLSTGGGAMIYYLAYKKLPIFD
ncbi:MAG: phosphoglycerate kinase [Candidatus Parcubacteria bacterium]|nr:MAG: phosphoglycerate kinase [Candidatus Parcubacteria bacterium]